MLNYKTDREEDLRYRNNKHDFNCEGETTVRFSCGVYVGLCFIPFQFQNFSIKNPIVNLKLSVKGMYY